MEVSYSVMMEDEVALIRYIARKFGPGWGGYLASWAAVPIFFAAMAVALYSLGKDYEDWAIATAAAGVIGTLGYPIMYRRSMNRQIRDHLRKTSSDKECGRRRAIFSDESLIVVSAMERLEWKWEALDQVEEASDTTYVFVPGGVVVILPRHGFERSGDYDNARDFAFRKLRERAKS